jgi:poly-gamma-glutamate synthesis protein (capsule biosynthesis protein)
MKSYKIVLGLLVLIIGTIAIGRYSVGREQQMTLIAQPSMLSQSAITPPVAESPTSTPVASSKVPAILLTFVGDIMLDRDVWDRMQQSGTDYPFQKIGDLFAGSDAAIANLEGPVTTRGTHSVVGGSLIFSFDPSVVSPLKQAGITAVSLANNHTYNQGQVGLDETRSNLDAAGIIKFGDPRKVDASFVEHLTIHDQTFSLIGWNTIEVSDSHLSDLLALIRAEQTANDFVVVMPHWGVEYQQQTAKQIDAAHQIIDAGADLIIGTHPHVVQGYEKYHDRLIMYSLGNFIFDQYWSVPTQRAIAVRYVIETDRQTATIVPLRLEKAQPTKALGDIHDQILKQLDLSSDMITIP